MRKLLTLLLLLSCCLSVPAQKGKPQRKQTTTQQTPQKKKPAATSGKKTTTTKKTAPKTAPKATQKQNNGKKAPVTVKGLQKEQKDIQQKKEANIKKQKQLEMGVKRGMENLMILHQEIARQRKVVDTIRDDVVRLTRHIRLLDRQYAVLTEELEERRNRYIQSMRYMHRNRSVQNQLLFIFSADNFNQMYRRLRFSREYAAYQKAQGEAVKSKQEQVELKKKELTQSKEQKSALLERGVKEQQALEGKQSQQKAQVEQLKKQQRTVEALIVEQQRRENELNARIDKLIAEELARERARLEAEAKKKAAEEAARKRAEEQASNKDNTKPARKQDKARERETAESKKDTETYRVPSEDRKLTGGFEANKGRLPIPITGAYRLVRGYGTYVPEGLSHVRLQSNGWHLKGQSGAKAQCIFDGEVSGVYFQGGKYIVTVRHGKYISAYINLAKAHVNKGQRVKTRDVIGTLGDDHIMQFQLRNWNALLNPAHWLGR